MKDKIENSRDDIEYICGLNSEETEPKDKEINWIVITKGYKTGKKRQVNKIDA